MIPRLQNRGHSFKGVTAYLMHDKEAKTSDRVVWSETANLHTNDLEKASKVMAWTDINAETLKANAGGSMTGPKVSKGGVLHYSLSWAEGEHPSKEHMRAQVHKTLELQGLSEHQYYMVAHNDTAHAHVHVVVNLTHPETGVRQKLGLNKRALQTYALEYEKQHGMHCHAREQNAELRQKDTAKDYYPTQKERHAAQVTRAFEASDNAQSFKAALEAEGLLLANGRRAFMAVDRDGNTVNLARVINGYKTKDIKQKLGEIDRTTLPQVDDLAALIKDQKAIRDELVAKDITQQFNAQQESIQEHDRTEDTTGKTTLEIANDETKLAHNPLQDLRRWMDADRRSGGNHSLFAGSRGSSAKDYTLRPLRTEAGTAFTGGKAGKESREPRQGRSGIAAETNRRPKSIDRGIEENEQQRLERIESEYDAYIEAHTQQSRERWNIEALETQYADHRAELDARSGFFSRYIFRSKFVAARDQYEQTQRDLSENLTQHQAEVETLERKRAEWFKSQDFYKQSDMAPVLGADAHALLLDNKRRIKGRSSLEDWESVAMWNDAARLSPAPAQSVELSKEQQLAEDMRLQREEMEADSWEQKYEAPEFENDTQRQLYEDMQEQRQEIDLDDDDGLSR